MSGTEERERERTGVPASTYKRTRGTSRLNGKRGARRGSYVDVSGWQQRQRQQQRGRLLNEFLNRKGFRPSFVHPLWLGMAPSYRRKRTGVFGEPEGLAVVKREENNRFPRRASFEPPCHIDSRSAPTTLRATKRVEKK